MPGHAQRLGADVGGQAGGVGHAVVERISAAAQGGAGDGHGLASAHVLGIKSAGATGQCHGVAADQASQGAAAQGRAGGGVVDPAGGGLPGHAQRLGADVGRGGSAVIDAVIVCIRAGLADAADRDGLAGCNVLIAESGVAVGKADDITANEAGAAQANGRRGAAVVGFVGGGSGDGDGFGCDVGSCSLACVQAVVAGQAAVGTIGQCRAVNGD